MNLWCFYGCYSDSVNARASTNRVDLAGYIIALHTLIVPFSKCHFLEKRGFLVIQNCLIILAFKHCIMYGDLTLWCAVATLITRACERSYWNTSLRVYLITDGNCTIMCVIPVLLPGNADFYFQTYETRVNGLYYKSYLHWDNT